MKKSVLKTVSLLLSFAAISLLTFFNLSAVENQDVKPDASLIQQTRFENMLNHSYVYGEDFDSLSAIVNNSVVALLDLRDGEDDSYISQNIVNSYLYDMFGFKIEDFSSINTEFPQKEGYVYILPRGYELYEHNVKSVLKNEDGSFTCITDVTVKTHDGQCDKLTAETLFVVNNTSAFGYNIVVSDFIDA